MGIIALRAAKREVYLYRREFRRFRKSQRSQSRDRVEQLLKDHEKAMECRDCEDFLCLGIEAFQWLQKAHQSIQDDVYHGRSVYDEHVEHAITKLYQGWLKPYHTAERWMTSLQGQGFELDKAVDFVRCCHQASAILEERTMAEAARRARLQSADDDPSG